jgi:hypothetical protein
MRGRIGGRIGVSYSPASGYTSGVWRLADVYAAKAGAYGFDPYGSSQPWPSRNLTIAWPFSGWPSYSPIDYADATQNGSATFNASVGGDYSLNGTEFAYFWERSTDAGATWATVAASSGSFTLDTYGNTVSLERTGQTIANNGELYRLAVINGLKAVFGPSGTMQFDTVTISFSYNPTSIIRSAGQNAYFESQASAVGQTYGRAYGGSYQWQRSTNGGSTWADFGSADYWLQFTVAAADNGYRYRLKFASSGQVAYSTSATLIVE